jgi:hypothetical protein
MDYAYPPIVGHALWIEVSENAHHLHLHHAYGGARAHYWCLLPCLFMLAGVEPQPGSGGVPTARSALAAARGTITLHAPNSPDPIYLGCHPYMGRLVPYSTHN